MWKIKYKNKGVNVKDGKEEFNFLREGDDVIISFPKNYLEKGTIRNAKFITGFDKTNVLVMEKETRNGNKLIHLKHIDFYADGSIKIETVKGT